MTTFVGTFLEELLQESLPELRQVAANICADQKTQLLERIRIEQVRAVRLYWLCTCRATSLNYIFLALGFRSAKERSMCRSADHLTLGSPHELVNVKVAGRS